MGMLDRLIFNFFIIYGPLMIKKQVTGNRNSHMVTLGPGHMSHMAVEGAAPIDHRDQAVGETRHDDMRPCPPWTTIRSGGNVRKRHWRPYIALA